MDNIYIKNILQNFKTCKECNETKDKYHFEPHRAKCKQCTSIRKKTFYNEHKEQWKKYYKYVRKTMPIPQPPISTV